MSSEQELVIEKIQILKCEISNHMILLDHFLDNLVIANTEAKHVEKLDKIITCLKKDVKSSCDLHSIILSDCDEPENALKF